MDYNPLDLPERTACIACGRNWSHYVEKLTDERRKREDKTARRICRTCYQRAKERAQQHAVILPGAFDIARLERLKVGVGRCTVCDLDRAAYIDRGAGMALCESCYQRVAKDNNQGEVTG